MRKKLTFHGVDIDKDYVVTCQKSVSAAGLSSLVTNQHQSIYDYAAPAGTVYDVAYFGASFMLMPDPVQCLVHVKTLVKPNANIYFTQTFMERRIWLMDFIKPIMTWLYVNLCQLTVTTLIRLQRLINTNCLHWLVRN